MISCSQGTDYYTGASASDLAIARGERRRGNERKARFFRIPGAGKGLT